MIERHLKDLSEIAVKAPKTMFGVQELIDIILDIKTDISRQEVVVDGDELTKYFGKKNKTSVPMSPHEINEGLA